MVETTTRPAPGPAASVHLSLDEVRLLLSPWYHDFEPLGMWTPQRGGIFRPNQMAKQPVLFGLVDQALDLCREKGDALRGVELFCADGFYANYAVQRGAAFVKGLDLESVELAKAEVITRVLGNSERVQFEKRNVFDLDGVYDFGICAGGLYHLSNPEDLLTFLRSRIRTALVIQTVYSLENPAADYFETPAPGWTWGSRFSHAWLLAMVHRAGWDVAAGTTNELGGNDKLQDRGSAYMLCVPRESHPGVGPTPGPSPELTIRRLQELRRSLPNGSRPR